MTTNSEIKKHVDWSIIGVVGTIVGLLIQSATIVWWASGLNEKVANIERQMIDANRTSATLAALDERTRAIQTDTARINQRMDAVEARGR